MLRSGGEEDSREEMEDAVEKMARTGVDVTFLSMFGVGVLRSEE